MKLRWPWQRNARGNRQDRLVFCSTPEGLAWLRAEPAGGRLRLASHGELARDGQTDAEWTRAVRQLGLLNGSPATAVLPLQAYQLLQIEAPVVPADELRAAARWRAKDMVNGHIDDVTLDVMRLGQPGSQVQGHEQMFVVAAPNKEVAAAAALATGAGWRLAVVDVADNAQRNLQHAAATQMDLADRATACLAVHDHKTCLLTICAGGELYYSRRLEWDPALLARAERAAAPAATAAPALPATPDSTAHHYMLGDAQMVAAGSDIAADLPHDAPRSFSFDDPLLSADDGLAAFAPAATAAYTPASAAIEFAADDTPRMVIELQRSFDVWERSWPQLPLSLLMLQPPGEATHAASVVAASFLQEQLGLRVLPLDLSAGLDLGERPAGTLPPLSLLGALLRDRPEA